MSLFFLSLADTNSFIRTVINALLGISLLANIIGGGIVCIIFWRKRNVAKQSIDIMQHPPQLLPIPQSQVLSTSNLQDRPISVEYDEINETTSNVTTMPVDNRNMESIILTQARPSSRIQPSVTSANMPVNTGDPDFQYDDVLNLQNKQEVGEYHYIVHKGRKS
jgi:hypothetical protein